MEAIGRIYCKGNHKDVTHDGGGMCAECRNAIEATLARAQSCPLGHTGNCQDCAIKCQRGEAQTTIRRIMRYAAPRMAFRHPVMTLGYLRKKTSAASKS